MNPEISNGIEDRSRALVEFDRFHAGRIRAESRAESRALAADEVTPLQIEILHHALKGRCTPVWLSWRMQIDAGHVSRTLRFMEEMRYLKMTCAPDDRRRREVELTVLGRGCAESLEKSRTDRARSLLEGLRPGEQEELVAAMRTVTRLIRRAAGIMSA